MAAERITLNPKTENQANSPLELASGNGIELVSHKWPWPELEGAWASSPETLGELLAGQHHKNVEAPLKLRVREPTDEPAATNSVNNPSFEEGTNNWAMEGASGVTLSQAGSQTPPVGCGDYYLSVVTNGAASAQGAASDTAATTPSSTYRGSVWVKGNSGGEALSVVLVEDGIGSTAASFTATTSWQRVSVSRAFGGSGTAARIIVRCQGTAAVTFFLDGAQVEIASAVTPYFDGDTPGCKWSGAPHASRSTRPAIGGPRFAAILADLEAACWRATTERGGNARRIATDGYGLTFDLEAAKVNIDPGWRYVLKKDVEVECELTLRPVGYGAEVTLSDMVETTLPMLRGVVSGVKGNAPGRARIVIDNDAALYQLTVDFGYQQFYDSAASAELFFEAEAREALGGSTAVGYGGASGGSAVRRSNIPTTALAVWGTRSSGGIHASHVGQFRVIARVAPTVLIDSTVTLSLQWSVGDLQNFEKNPEVELDASFNGNWHRVDLGTIQIPQVPAGTQTWEGRIVARSTDPTNDIDIDWVELIPCDLIGRVTVPVQAEVPSVFLAHDEFRQTAGALTGKALPDAGTWTVLAGSDADDFQIDATNDLAYRSAVSDATLWPGRCVTVDSTAYTLVGAQVDVQLDTLVGAHLGLAIRVASATAFLFAGLDTTGSDPLVGVQRASSSSGYSSLGWLEITDDAALTEWTVRIVADTLGRWWFWAGPAGSPLKAPIRRGYSADLLLGGALDDGRVGLLDSCTGAVASTRRYRNFMVFTPAVLGAIVASGSLELGWDDCIREAAGGAVWVPSTYEGDRFYIPPSGPDNRSGRVAVKLSRGDYEGMPDLSYDDLSAQIMYRPGWVVTAGE